MKRTTAWLTVFCLIVTCILPVRAAEAELYAPVQTRASAEATGQQRENQVSEPESNVKTETGNENAGSSDREQEETESGSETGGEEGSEPDLEPDGGNGSGTENDGGENGSESDGDGSRPGDGDNGDGNGDSGGDDGENKDPGTDEGEDKDSGADEGEDKEPGTDDEEGEGSGTEEEGEEEEGEEEDSETEDEELKDPDKTDVKDKDKLKEDSEEEEEEEEASLSEEENWNEEKAPSDAKGSIEVIFRNVLPVSNLFLTAWLEGSGQSQDVKLGNNPDKHMVEFEGLSPGTYTLKVSASGFVTYEQEIKVEGNIMTAEIHTGFVDPEGFKPEGYTYDEIKPGVMLIGDVNGDGSIDEEDRAAIVRAISGIENQGMTDLNRDGRTDLVDLQYYANSRAAGESGEAALSERIAPGAVKVNYNGSNTEVIEGNLAELPYGDGNVTLGTSNGEEVSENSPLEIGFYLQSEEQEEKGEYVPVEQILITMGEHAIDSGELILYTDEDGEGQSIEIRDGKAITNTYRMARQQEYSESNSQLTINLGGQVAVKKVTLRITKTSDGGTLAQISKVEFLNDMEKRIPEPELDIPEILSVTGGDKSFDVIWSKENNITGYEVEIGQEGMEGTETVRAASTSLKIQSFQGSKLENGATYSVRVRSVNGTWSSGYSNSVSATPAATKKPYPPDNLRATGGYRSIHLSWKSMKDTDFYNVYYRKAGDASYQKVSDIAQNQYEITGLEDQKKYEVYVTGENQLGESGPSLVSAAETIVIVPAQMPEYKLINKSLGEGKLSAHIENVTHGRGEMVNSPLDEGDSKSALGTADKNSASYYQILDWDDGASYPAASKGLLFTLDDYYKMSYITFAESEDIGSYGGAYVYYYDQEHPNGTAAQNVSLVQRTDANGRKYYMIKLAKPITANKIRLGFTRGYNYRNIVIAEVNFYHYDSLEDDILALYADDLHTSLREDVTEKTIEDLQKRLDTIDEESGEYHPERSVLQKELDNARGLLTPGFQEILYIHPQITAARDKHLGFSGLNAWQPLGITAYEGEQIVIYVGHNQLKTGANSALKLISTQYHAEASALAKEVATLKVGRNEITIPSIQSIDCEGGGALYIQYTGNNVNDRYAVRVNGGVREPVLDLYGITDGQERQKLVTAYVKELEEHVASQEERHREIHEGAGEGNKVNRSYDKKNCIIGATDIMLDQMLLSVSVERILAGLGNGSTEERAEKLNQSLYAMDDMMTLFYQHKGLTTEEGAPTTDRMPAQHLNIRYMRMFAGAFMYASGNHIGIEWGSLSGLATASPVQSDEKGKYISGNYFGWGIGHEIGHNINQGSYAIAEVTNNYFAQLAGAKDSNASVRFKYPEVYKKVTSNTVGKPSNVFTHLAMYWQLHLAYDRDYNYKTYDSYEEQMKNLFYARVDSYSRNTSLAPGSLSLNGGVDQNFMRLACAASEKDLTEFFIRWGLVPDGETVSYASQFPKEERAVYYLTDDARVYEMEHGATGSVKGKDVIGQGSSVAVSEGIPNEVNISIQCTADADVILGYEIVRYQYENGQPVRQVIGFSTESTYQDHVAVINNRVLTYEVTAVDKFGYRSNAKQIGDVRIAHDGSHDKSMWTITTNMASGSDGYDKENATEEDPCAPEAVSAISMVADNDYGKTYEGQTTGEDATVLIRMNQALAVCGLKYTLKSGTPIGDYKIEISVDGSSWTQVKTGSFEKKTGSQTVYFENEAKDPWVCTYDAAYVRLTALGQRGMNITELDLLGPSGDDISFGLTEEGMDGAVGILKEDYFYEPGDESRVIPKGSLVFMGNYKGNPAYNVVILYDENGNIVGGVDEDNVLKAEQIILAKVPENGLLGEVSDGIWIYWLEPQNGQAPAISGKVRAQLYRVDNALTNEGQRLVSDTMPLQIPDTLKEITFKKDGETENSTASQ